MDEKLVVCGDARCPRADKYKNLKAAVSAGEDGLARNYSSSFGWELDAMKVTTGTVLEYDRAPADTSIVYTQPRIGIPCHAG